MEQYDKAAAAALLAQERVLTLRNDEIDEIWDLLSVRRDELTHPCTESVCADCIELAMIETILTKLPI